MEDIEEFALKDFHLIAKALSKQVRIDILSLIAQKPLNVKEIALYLGIPISTAATNIKILKQADLINKDAKPGIHGKQKICSLKHSSLLLNLKDRENQIDEKKLQKRIEVSMPVGNFINCKISPPCGLAGSNKMIGKPDKIATFYVPEKVEAQLLWAGRDSQVEYHFPLSIPSRSKVTSIELSFELCSETNSYNEDFPSDITIWINEIEVGTFTSPGDFGGKHGKFTPPYWKDFLTQFGILTVWEIDSEGTFIDEKRVSDVTIERLEEFLNPNLKPYLSVKIGVKDDAENIGGFNLFGSKFGNYNQDIKLRIYYNKSKIKRSSNQRKKK